MFMEEVCKVGGRERRRWAQTLQMWQKEDTKRKWSTSKIVRTVGNVHIPMKLGSVMNTETLK